ncbi:5-formyltetrahydrofolate cyclo-ligase [Neobacillus niacini]|jgi:5-formyltetrahydrofolate cyclo-ligase|uniref:5-formyltetrahydrofolate cyclo-ligase n=1 Tax=Neobacillus niacini TaxID=86668 RepID=UPI0027867458|nr:5-formyltetrahydrofolate cyclo-ligase [Neobacillus niacini]MDQ1001507.1 5-formyltetrahydrofolate cyclo-ligase [Neobacillus niacini]
MTEKKLIRKEMKECLALLTKPYYEHYSHIIANTLYKDEDWLNANVIGITISKEPEVDTYQIIRKAWEEGKEVVVPKCNPETKTLSFRKITEFSQLESVFYGLLEPIIELTMKVKPEEIDLLFVPGLAYTREGFRLGFGGGYYDRYLTNYKGNTLSLAFYFQVIPQFPIEKHDIPVSKIITNDEVIKIK